MIDPMAFKYFSTSPYIYGNNNPLRFIDPDGREVIGMNYEDIVQALADIKQILGGDKFAKVRDLLSADRKTFAINKISKEKLDLALAGIELDDDEKQTLSTIVNTINSKDIHQVEYMKSTDVLSKSQLKQYNVNSDLINLLDGKVTASIVNSGTVKTNKGTMTIMVNGGLSANDYFDNITKSKGDNPIGRPGILMHEVFGHGRSLMLGNGLDQHVETIRFENMILRIMGHPNIQRTGENHDKGKKIENPSIRPNYQ